MILLHTIFLNDITGSVTANQRPPPTKERSTPGSCERNEAVSSRLSFTKYKMALSTRLTLLRRLSANPCLQIRTMASLLHDKKTYINGEWVGSSNGETFDVLNPSNGQVVGTVPNMTATEANTAVDAAQKAFQTWQETTVKERSVLLRKWFNLCVEHNEELAKLLTAEQGKPIAESRGEVAYGGGFLEWFAEEARRMYGETVPSSTKGKELVFIKQPIGVAAMITPWNFPNAMITRKAGAALAAGCTCVIKPAQDTPLSAIALAALAHEAGIPKGVINVVTCRHANSSAVGKVFCDREEVAAMSFTGSTHVGKILYRQCAGTVKKLSLELGGNAPFIVFDSADVDLAVAGCMVSKFRNMGQTCVSTNRVFVQDGIYDKFVTKLQDAVEKQLVIGDGMADGVNQGPLVNKSQFDTVCNMVTDAVKKGAKVVLGGSKDDKGDLFYKPTILTDINSSMECFHEEIFGPVISIIRFKEEQEAVSMANDSRVGLAGYFYSNDVKQCWRVGRKLEVGMVGINEGMISAPEAAFGGVKESGLGREGSRHGIDEYSEIKYMCFGNLS